MTAEANLLRCVDEYLTLPHDSDAAEVTWCACLDWMEQSYLAGGYTQEQVAGMDCKSALEELIERKRNET